MGLCRQLVSWALEVPCAYRPPPDWQRPDKAHEELLELRILSDSESFEGFCVASSIGVPDNLGKIHPFPHIGFKLTGALLDHGTELCMACPGNIGSEGIAGCHGSFGMDPSHEELHTLVEQRVRSVGLESELSALFPVTRPRWFGFWIDSPLSPEQRTALGKLFEEFEDEDFEHFRKALSSQLRLHVSLSPPQGASFGWCTTFGHCDRCKAIPDLELDYDAHQVCQVCGHSYRPRDNQRSEQMWVPTALEVVVGKKEHRGLMDRLLRNRGCSAEQSASIYENFLNGKFQLR